MLDKKIETRKVAKILPEECIGCMACRQICPENAISEGADSKFVVDPQICSFCQACIGMCPVSAIIETTVPINS